MSTTATATATTTASLPPQPGYDVQDKVVLVTGASRGIGAAFVYALLQHGVRKVYAAVRNVEAAQKLYYQQQHQHDNDDDEKVCVIYMDLSKPETIQQAATIATDVHVVINNAGVLTQTSPLDANCIPNLQYELSVNCFGLIHMAQQFAPILKQNGGGVFCQINSVASFRSSPGIGSTYAASKAAAFSITQTLRHLLLHQQNTHVISVHPGPIATDMIHQIGSSELNDMAAPAEQVAEEVIQAMKQGGVFLVYPDAKSKQLQKVYQEFATAVIEAGNMYND